MTPPPSPLLATALALAIGGAIADWRYKKSGGKRPDKSEKRGLTKATIVAAAVVLLIFIFESPEEAGGWTATLALLLFAFWEASRWRIRRDNPIFPSRGKGD
jgi:peptidoglycan/LPS O-acetylase OafA/YrhL